MCRGIVPGITLLYNIFMTVVTFNFLDINDPRGRHGHLKYKNTWEAFGKIKTLREINIYGSQLSEELREYLDPNFSQLKNVHSYMTHNAFEMRLKKMLPDIKISYKHNCGSLMNNGKKDCPFQF